MPNNNYTRGSYLERRGAELLMRMGYFVIRAAGSHGVADLVAIHKYTRPLLVQAKSGGVMSHNDWNNLYLAAEVVDATPLLLKWNNTHRKVEWVQLLGEHEPRSRVWLDAEWSCPIPVRP